MYILARWFLNAVTLLAIANYLPGVGVNSFYSALITALVLGLVNAVIRPIILLLTLPITIVTLGLFTLVINGLLFWFVSTVVEGFTVDGFTTALLGALIMTVASWIISWLLKKDNRS